MSEYRVKITVRNNLLLAAIERAVGIYGNGAQSTFARSIDIGIGALNSLVAMRIAPILENGEFSEIAKRVMEALGASPSDLWTDRQLCSRLQRNSGEVLIDKRAVDAMLEQHTSNMMLPDPSDVLERSEVAERIQSIIATLKPREQAVLRCRFFNDMTLEETADIMDVSRERIRQIELKALRRLRKPKRSKELITFINNV